MIVYYKGDGIMTSKKALSGVQEYNNGYYDKAMRVIDSNRDIKYLEDFYMSMNDNGNATKYLYITRVVNFARYTNKLNAGDIKLVDYTKFLASINDMTAGYQKTTYAALKKLSSFIGEYGLGKDYVTKKLKTKQKESAATAKRREKSYLTDEEMETLIQHVKNTCKDPRWRQRDVAMMYLFRASGIRRAALQKLDMEDIDFEEGTINVTEKGGKIRTVYLDDETVNELKKWCDCRKYLHLTDTNAVFVSTHLQRMSLPNINYLFTVYGKIFPDKHLSPHKLRASYGTSLYEETHDVYFVQKAMGHSDPSVTEIYIRGQENATKEARDILMRRRKERK